MLSLEIVAHRGVPDQAPENTIPSQAPQFRQALRS